MRLAHQSDMTQPVKLRSFFRYPSVVGFSHDHLSLILLSEGHQTADNVPSARTDASQSCAAARRSELEATHSCT